jgi:hypothetical protein
MMEGIGGLRRSLTLNKGKDGICVSRKISFLEKSTVH